MTTHEPPVPDAVVAVIGTPAEIELYRRQLRGALQILVQVNGIFAKLGIPPLAAVGALSETLASVIACSRDAEHRDKTVEDWTTIIRARVPKLAALYEAEAISKATKEAEHATKH